VSLLAFLLIGQVAQADGRDRQPAARSYAGEEAPAVTVPRIDAEVRVDGVLDEPVWANAARLVGFHQYEPVDGRAAEERTEVLVWYSATAVHFGVRAWDRVPESIRATRAERDNIDDEDHVIIYLDTFNDRRRAFFFGVNALGVQQDGVRTEGSSAAGRPFGGSIDRNPDYTWDSGGRVTAEGWEAEIRIPFKSLRYPSGDEQSWGINVIREIQRTGHTDSWVAARRASNSFLTQVGSLEGLRDLRRGVVVDAQPFVTLSGQGARDDVTDVFRRADVDPQAGLNLRLGFPSVALDMTYNPDFSQVETDEGQVTLNERFALFFAEKRPFFLEGIELFAAPNRLIYSRQISDPVVGAKLTGKVGPLGVAHLTALDENVDAAGREALFNVTRLRRDIGAGSLAGISFTDRSVLDTEDYNRVLAADARLVFGGLYYVEAQAGWSWTQDGLDGRRDAPIWSAEFDRTGHTWGFNYQLTGIAEDFETRAGFVPRSGIVEGRAFNRLSYYGEPGAALERITMFFGPTRIWNHDDFLSRGAIEGRENASFTARFRGGWEATAEAGRRFAELDAAAYRVYTSGGSGYTPLDGVSGPAFGLRGNTPTFRGFDAQASVSRERSAIFPEGSEGTTSSASATLNLRPSDAVRLTLSTRYARLVRSRDGSEFARSVIPRLRAELQPTRALLFRAVAEYRAERQAALRDARTGAPLLVADEPVDAIRLGSLRYDLLASFRPTPGTIAFIGYGSSLEGRADFALRDLERHRDGFFIKLAYQFRR
jgi:hypothetical protein